MSVKHKNIFVQGPVTPELIAASIAAHGKKKNIGAHAIFLGQVRADQIGDQTVHAITYSAYEEMCLEKAHEIREETFARYPLVCMHIYHSLGPVKAGEICLFIFTSSVHRSAATAACNEMVERIKKELPVWGKELLDEGSQWKVNTVSKEETK